MASNVENLSIDDVIMHHISEITMYVTTICDIYGILDYDWIIYGTDEKSHYITESNWLSRPTANKHWDNVDTIFWSV